MPWVGYGIGLFVGSVFGYALHDLWEGDLTGVGSPPPPEIDLAVPLVLFVLATGAIAASGKRRHRTP